MVECQCLSGVTFNIGVEILTSFDCAAFLIIKFRYQDGGCCMVRFINVGVRKWSGPFQRQAT